MPIIYAKRDRKRLQVVDLEKFKSKLLELGYTYIRDGGFRAEDKPFKWCNYLFYRHPKTKKSVRIGYEYPILRERNAIFEICIANNGDEWWTDILPDYRKNFWKTIKRK